MTRRREAATHGRIEEEFLLGREAAVAQVRDVANNRESFGRTLVVSGPSGIGKTSLLRQALAGFEGDVMWFSGHGERGSKPWAGLLNASTALRSVPGFADLPPEPSVPEAVSGRLSVAELGRLAAERFRAMPRRERPVVVVADDMHRGDPESLELLIFLAHLNHTFDVSYILTCLDTQIPTESEDLPRVALTGLALTNARSALERWTHQVVDEDVASMLVRSTDGNPRLLKRLAERLSPDQLAGYRAASVVPSLPRPSLVPVDPVLALGPEQLRALACFAISPRVPSDVFRDVAGESAGTLVDQGMIAESIGAFEIDRAALGWLAESSLTRQQQQDLWAALAEAWKPVDPVLAAFHACRAAPNAAEVISRARRVLSGADNYPSGSLLEALAQAVTAGARPSATKDWLNLASQAEAAGHLLDARDAFEQAISAPDLDPSVDYAALARWRRFFSQVVDEPAIAVPSARLLEDFETLKPAVLFEVATRTAWNALLVGDRGQARRYLDRARLASRSARSSDRALWRLVDVSWQRDAGEERPEVLREAALRWRHASDARDWYDDILVVHSLLEAGAVDEAHQELNVASSTHRRAGRHWNYFLDAMLVRTHLATSNVAAALQAAARLRDSGLRKPLHVHGLGPALVRLEAIAGLSSGELASTEQAPYLPEAGSLVAAQAEADLIRGHYDRASVAYAALLRQQPPLPPERRWSALADLLEALVARGMPEAAEEAFATRAPTTPTGSAAVIARAAALGAPAFSTRSAFARALDIAEERGTLVELARTRLAFARRLSAAGASDEAAAFRADAALLFEHDGMQGWKHNAEMLEITMRTAPASSLALTEPLDDQETAIVRLLVQGLRNQQVADQLFISLRTLEKSLTRIYAKLGVSSKARMIALLRGAVGDETPPE